MLEQAIYQKAMKFAGEKHHSQLVPGSNANYLLHLSNIAMEVIVAFMHEPTFNINLAVELAILHDTLEDTPTTYEELKEQFTEQVAIGVKALTKDNGLPNKSTKMADSISRIKASYKEVAIVKLADRITNLQTPPKTWTQEKIKSYKEEAKFIAVNLKGYNLYLDKRIELAISSYNK